MSKLHKGLYSSEKQDWRTPDGFIKQLLEVLGTDRFYLDPCCTDANIPAQYHAIDGKTDGLAANWGPDGAFVFMNPPYGRELQKWVKKAYMEGQRGVIVLGLIPARPDTKYWYDYVFRAEAVFFLKGRLKFYRPGQAEAGDGTAPFPTALVIWGCADKTKWLHNLAVKLDEHIAGTMMERMKDSE